MTTTAGHLHFTPTAVPCPSWCTEPPGHSYEQQDDDGAEMRDHVKGHGESGVSADLVSLYVWRDGKETPASPPSIQVWIGGTAHEEMITDPGQARGLAAALMDSADALAAIQSEARR